MKKLSQKQKRKLRVRKKVFGTADCPRMSVCRSNKNLTVQLIDDEARITLVGMTTAAQSDTKGTKTEHAFELGKKIAAAAKRKKITKVVFDRGSSKFHGRVKQVAEGARESGLEF